MTKNTTINAAHRWMCGAVEERAELLLEDLDSLHGWLGQLDAQFRRGDGDRARFDHRLRATFDEVLAEYFSAAVQMRAAELIAGQGEGEEPLEPEAAEHLARNIMASDALLSASFIIEDAAPEVFRGEDKWFIAAAIQEARGRE